MAIHDDGLEWGEGFRTLGRQALLEVIEGWMEEAVDDWLDGHCFEERRIGATVAAAAIF